MLKYYARPIPGMKFNEAELRADYPNGARITLYGADNPDNLRGLGLWGVIFDEYAQQPPNIFSEIVSKCLADQNGYAIWIGTPMGKNDFYRLHEFAKKEFQKEDGDWYHQTRDIDETLAEEEGEVIDNLRKSFEEDKKLLEGGQIDRDEFNQEWYINFDAAIKGAYYADQISRAREEGRITRVPYDENLPVNTYWDLGHKDPTAILFMQNYRDEWRMIDYYESTGDSLHEYAKVLAEKKYIYGAHFLPHDAKVTEQGTGKSRRNMLQNLGVRPTRVVDNISVDNGIARVRMNFHKIWFDEKKCEEFIDKISQYRKKYDEKGRTFKPSPVHDFASHGADALRYWAVSLSGGEYEKRDKIKQVWNNLKEFNPFDVI